MKFIEPLLSDDLLVQEAVSSEKFNSDESDDYSTESESDYDDSSSDDDSSSFSDSDDDDDLSIGIRHLSIPQRKVISSEAQKLGFSFDAISDIVALTRASSSTTTEQQQQRFHESAGAGFVCATSSSNDQEQKNNKNQSSTTTTKERKPKDCLNEIVQNLIEEEGTMKSNSTNNTNFLSDGPFLNVSDQDVRGYAEVALAARQEDANGLRQLFQKGISLQSCNRHGESVVHIACRRSSVPLLKILMMEAKVSIRVRDDMWKTALHDAAWTTNPNFELVTMLLQDSPDLLFAKDKRGHLALDYVPQKVWGEWCNFLNSNPQLVTAAMKSPYTTTSTTTVSQ